MIERHDYYAYLLISSLLEAARAAIGKERNVKGSVGKNLVGVVILL